MVRVLVKPKCSRVNGSDGKTSASTASLSFSAVAVAAELVAIESLSSPPVSVIEGTVYRQLAFMANRIWNGPPFKSCSSTDHGRPRVSQLSSTQIWVRNSLNANSTRALRTCPAWMGDKAFLWSRIFQQALERCVDGLTSLRCLGSRLRPYHTACQTHLRLA